MKQALYRALRSQRFSEVVGQETIIRTLRGQIMSGRISHAYLFSGTRGTGKTSVAKIFSRAVNCEHPEDGDLCGRCERCLALARDNLDIIEIDAASNNGVDEIRDLRDKVKYPPQFGRFRVYIIDEVHMLSSGAFNALLKTLEEPPEHIIFILATTEPQRLPATILSRCQRFDFRRIPLDKVVGHLKYAVGYLEAQADEGALVEIARATEGAMRDALSLLDMCASMGGGDITQDGVREALGASGRGFLMAFGRALAEGDAGAALRLIDEGMRAGRDAIVFSHEVSDLMQQCMVAQLCGEDAPAILDVTPEEAGAIRSLAAALGEGRALRALSLFSKAEAEMRWASRQRAMLELCAVRACRPEVDKSLEGVEARLEALEKRLAAFEERGLVMAAPAHAAPAEEDKPVKTAKKRAAAPPAPANQEGEALYGDMMKWLEKNNMSAYTVLHQFFKYRTMEGDTVVVEALPTTADIMFTAVGKYQDAGVFAAALAEGAGRPVTCAFVKSGEAAEEGDPTLEEKALSLFDRDKVVLGEIDEV